jgi:hypothetical protein
MFHRGFLNIYAKVEKTSFFRCDINFNQSMEASNIKKGHAN